MCLQEVHNYTKSTHPKSVEACPSLHTIELAGQFTVLSQHHLDWSTWINQFMITNDHMSPADRVEHERRLEALVGHIIRKLYNDVPMKLKNGGHTLAAFLSHYDCGCVYKYGRGDQQNKLPCQKLTESVQWLETIIEYLDGVDYNILQLVKCAILNLHQSHFHSIGYHRDQDPIHGMHGIDLRCSDIGCISIAKKGVNKTLRLKYDRKVSNCDRILAEIDLTGIMVYVMKGECQKRFVHSVTHNNGVEGDRASITVRVHKRHTPECFFKPPKDCGYQPKDGKWYEPSKKKRYL